MNETRRLQKVTENWQLLIKYLAFLGQESPAHLQQGKINKQHLMDLLQLIIVHARKMRAEVHMLQLCEQVQTQKDIEDLIDKISSDSATVE